MNAKLLLGSLFLLFVAITGWLGIEQTRQALSYERNMEAYAKSLNYENRLLNVESWLAQEADDDLLARAARMRDRAREAHRQSRWYAWIIAGCCGLFLFIVFIFSSKILQKNSWRVGSLLLVALLCLLLGLFTPMLEIGAFERDLTIPIKINTGFFSLNIDHTQVFEGDLYFYYQSKSIVELISLLFAQNNWVVGLSILTFSIIIPISKLFFTFLSLLQLPFTQHIPFATFMQKVSRWSMADVFVAAIFLAFLAFSNMEVGIETQSRTLSGLYFFLGYVVIAVFVGYMGKSD